jgi:hypothetical protein
MLNFSPIVLKSSSIGVTIITKGKDMIQDLISGDVGIEIALFVPVNSVLIDGVGMVRFCRIDLGPS